MPVTDTTDTRKATDQITDQSTDDPRWAALQARDPKADSRFVYGVRTTGIYCRPSCPSRRARPDNIAFFDTPDAAQQAGFRACKRCSPDQPFPSGPAAKITALCRYIETAETVPTLDELAAQVGWSPYHLQRTFKAATGVTPRAYAAAHRTQRVKDRLARNGSVTDAIYSAGYNSNGRFYEESSQMLGMTPSQYRAGGINTVIRFAVGECSLGAILVAQSEQGICAILIDDDPEALVKDLQDRFPAAEMIAGDTGFESVVSRVVGFVEAPRTGLDLPLDIRGTAFQRRVWEVLRRIPAGETLSYTQVAEHIGSPKAFRAVAQACAANAIACAIPCHRVVRNDGGLSGYRWGVERKRTLLDREAQQQEAE